MKKLSFLFLILLTVFACRKDVEQLDTNTVPDDPGITELDYTPEVIEVSASLFGLVVDENNNPVENATIELDNNVTSSDEKGRFLITDIIMNQAGTLVTANKSGYFTGSHRFFPQGGSTNYAKIMLLDKTNIGNFSNSSGDSIFSSEGINIYFPANSVVNNNGNLHQGDVTVAARWIDPTADNLLEIMPGGLQGIRPSGFTSNNDSLEQVALASFGMMAVELTADDGSPLNLGNDQKATLSFPVPTAMQAAAPSVIPLWYFSDTYGIWVQQGSAMLIDGMYVGEVSHFSYWNCDDPYALVELSGTVVSTGGVPVANATVNLTLLSTGEIGGGFTDNNGVFSGLVPMGQQFELEIVVDNNSCYTTTIGPFNIDTNIGPISIADLLILNGTVIDCSSAPLAPSYIEIMVAGVEHHYYFDGSGAFTIAFLNCANATELTVTATNSNTLEAGSPTVYQITSNTLNLGAVSACGTVAPEYIQIIANNIDTTTFLNPTLFIDLNDTLYINASNPGTNHSINFRIADVTGIDFYDDVKLGIGNMGLNNGNIGDAYTNSCGTYWTGTACGYDGTNITTFGAVGQEIKGTFTGTADFDIISGGTTQVSFVGEFKIIRD